VVKEFRGISITGKPWPSAPGTTRKFRRLRELLDERYTVRLRGNGFLIHERID
jgi:hypothetical protein